MKLAGWRGGGGAGKGSGAIWAACVDNEGAVLGVSHHEIGGLRGAGRAEKEGAGGMGGRGDGKGLLMGMR